VRLEGHLVAELAQMQDKLIARYPPLAAMRIPPAKMHLTLLTFSAHLVRDALELFGAPKIDANTLTGSMLTLKGLGNFSQNVLFAKVSQDDAYSSLCSLLDKGVVEYMRSRGHVLEQRSQPHVTLFKASVDRSSSIRGGARARIPLRPQMWSEHKDVFWGTTPISAIQLMRMGSTADDGYYEVLASVPVGWQAPPAQLPVWIEAVTSSSIRVCINATDRTLAGHTALPPSRQECNEGADYGRVLQPSRQRGEGTNVISVLEVVSARSVRFSIRVADFKGTPSKHA